MCVTVNKSFFCQEENIVCTLQSWPQHLLVVETLFCLSGCRSSTGSTLPFKGIIRLVQAKLTLRPVKAIMNYVAGGYIYIRLDAKKPYSIFRTG